MSLIIKSGNLLDASETYLCHQTNCVSHRAAHCAKAVFDRFPFANVYRDRIGSSVPGTIDIKGNGTNKRYVISLFGQFYPGKPKWPTGMDSRVKREQYFSLCLDEMAALPGSFAFPYIIGCGAAGGCEARYLDMLERFAADREVSLYRLELK